MKTKVWLIVSGTLLIANQLHAGDPGYDNRQLSINPGNMMDGMFNPMNSFFGGSDRYPNDYYNYRYAPPPAYPPVYGHPGTDYGYPPVHPGYQSLPQTGGYPSPPAPAQQPQPSTVNVEPTPPPAYNRAPSVPPGYAEKYRFRPLEATEPAVENKGGSPYPQESAPQSGYSAAPPMGQTAAPQSRHAMEGGYGPSMGSQPQTQESQMKFRPLDQPGYTE
ncbi:MAG: hypothetical protein B6D72_16615 [gamma proteobacterium symbiont of Ctena orbiculata]|nr:MAG: hypothetical protein B6D72_16615 [gamma proteobacterium symbiont of Ctena orbiculata]PVV24467.1 MAG: hypothetical protein B6D74_05390 [gamma proteobacterium symbiont of Ctena orbiculata]